MSGNNRKNLLKNVASLLGVASASALLSLPALAAFNPSQPRGAESNLGTKQLLAQGTSPSASPSTGTDTTSPAASPSTGTDTTSPAASPSTDTTSPSASPSPSTSGGSSSGGSSTSGSSTSTTTTTTTTTKTRHTRHRRARATSGSGAVRGLW